MKHQLKDILANDIEESAKIAKTAEKLQQKSEELASRRAKHEQAISAILMPELDKIWKTADSLLSKMYSHEWRSKQEKYQAIEEILAYMPASTKKIKKQYSYNDGSNKHYAGEIALSWIMKMRAKPSAYYRHAKKVIYINQEYALFGFSNSNGTSETIQIPLSILSMSDSAFAQYFRLRVKLYNNVLLVERKTKESIEEYENKANQIQRQIDELESQKQKIVEAKENFILENSK